MKVARLVVAAGLGVLLWFPAKPASAHVLQQDSVTSAVLHIVPFDAPESNVPTKVELEFSNTAHAFRLNNYDITLAVSASGETVASKPVEAAYLGTQTTGLATITFPRANVYALRVKGTPKPGSTAAAFTFNFDTRVTAGAESGERAGRGTDPVLILAIGASLIILLAMLAIKQISSGGRYTRK